MPICWKSYIQTVTVAFKLYVHGLALCVCVYFKLYHKIDQQATNFLEQKQNAYGFNKWHFTSLIYYK